MLRSIEILVTPCATCGRLVTLHGRARSNAVRRGHGYCGADCGETGLCAHFIAVETPEQFQARFGSRITVDERGCWIVADGGDNGQGYVRVGNRCGRLVYLHRLAMMVYRPGALTPEKPCARRSCPPRCCNPWHHFPGTRPTSWMGGRGRNA